MMSSGAVARWAGKGNQATGLVSLRECCNREERSKGAENPTFRQPGVNCLVLVDSTHAATNFRLSRSSSGGLRLDRTGWGKVIAEGNQSVSGGKPG